MVAVAVVREKGLRPALFITVDYGQPAAAREIEAGRRVAEFYRCRHRVISLDWYRELLPESFSAGDRGIPDPEVLGQESAEAVWVPGRNLVLIAIGAAWAEKLGAGRLVTGFNAEEAATFPDNSREFVEVAGKALGYSSNGRVKLLAPLAGLDKSGIVKLGRCLGVPLELAWSCYRGGETPCGRCESCQRRAAAEAAMEEHG